MRWGWGKRSEAEAGLVGTGVKMCKLYWLVILLFFQVSYVRIRQTYLLQPDVVLNFFDVL